MRDKQSVHKAILVRKMQDYIHHNIKENITLKQLTKVANVSPSYGAKIFKDLTGKSPYNYIKSYRLTEAAKVLRDHDVKIIDVAFDYVFDSHEGFTRAFSKEFGLPPKEYSQHKPPIGWMSPATVSVKDKEDFEMNQFIFTQIIERPKRKVLISRAKTATEYFKYCEEVGCDPWGTLTSVKEALYEPAGFWLPKNLIKEGTSQYVQGVEIPLDYDNEVPEKFEIIELPESQIMIFQGPTYDDNYFEKHVSETMQAIKEFKPELYGYAYDETMPRFQLAPLGERGYIEGWPVKKLK